MRIKYDSIYASHITHLVLVCCSYNAYTHHTLWRHRGMGVRQWTNKGDIPFPWERSRVSKQFPIHLDRNTNSGNTTGAIHSFWPKLPEEVNPAWVTWQGMEMDALGTPLWNPLNTQVHIVEAHNRVSKVHIALLMSECLIKDLHLNYSVM